MTHKIKYGKCPRCKETCEMTWPALSRRDNETEICSSCGGDEALFDIEMFRKQQKLKTEYNNDEKMQKEIESQIAAERAWLDEVQNA